MKNSLMGGYYEDKLHGTRLKFCYEIAPPRIQQYLKAEIQYVSDNISPDCQLLELGCGYGRVLKPLVEKVTLACGIDTSHANLILGRKFLGDRRDCHLIRMDAVKMGFADGRFDYVICVQNGISAFHVDQRALIRESIRVTKDHGLIFLSSYSNKVWPARVQWFKAQAEAGLVGEIDWQRTGDGNIVCRDGFTATTVGQDAFARLVSDLPVDVRIEEVDESSIFCVLTARKAS